jgi:hypothetical protein
VRVIRDTVKNLLMERKEEREEEHDIKSTFGGQLH